MPELGIISPELASRTPREVIVIVSENYLIMGQHIQKLESRANCE